MKRYLVMGGLQGTIGTGWWSARLMTNDLDKAEVFLGDFDGNWAQIVDLEVGEVIRQRWAMPEGGATPGWGIEVLEQI